MDQLRIRVPDGLPQALVSGYLENCRHSLPLLKAALDRKDYEYMRVFGHRMKGSGGGYGFAGLSETGAQLEQAAQSRNDGELLNHAAALEQYLARVELASD